MRLRTQEGGRAGVCGGRRAVGVWVNGGDTRPSPQYGSHATAHTGGGQGRCVWLACRAARCPRLHGGMGQAATQHTPVCTHASTPEDSPLHPPPRAATPHPHAHLLDVAALPPMRTPPPMHTPPPRHTCLMCCTASRLPPLREVNSAVSNAAYAPSPCMHERVKSAASQQRTRAHLA